MSAEIEANLRKARLLYDNAPLPERRQIVAFVLVQCMDMIQAIEPWRAARLDEPLRELLCGLASLDQGTVEPILSPAKVNHRPAAGLTDEVFRGQIAAVLQIMIDRGDTEAVSANTIAGRVARAGYVRRDGGGVVSGATIKNWRKDAREKGSGNVGRSFKDFTLGRFYPPEILLEAICDRYRKSR